MPTNLTSEEKAKQVFDKLVSDAAFASTPRPKLGYPDESYSEVVGPNGEREHHVVWEHNGYFPDCYYLDQMQTNYGNWAAMTKTEYDSASVGHQDAAQYGLPEGIKWTFPYEGY